jgi:hypothetical protein
MKEVWLAQWSDDTTPQFASSTFEKLLEQIDDWYDFHTDGKVLKGKFQRDMSEHEGIRYGSIEYITYYGGEGQKDIVYILNYYYD